MTNVGYENERRLRSSRLDSRYHSNFLFKLGMKPHKRQSAQKNFPFPLCLLSYNRDEGSDGPKLLLGSGLGSRVRHLLFISSGHLQFGARRSAAGSITSLSSVTVFQRLSSRYHSICLYGLGMKLHIHYSTSLKIAKF